MSTDFLSRSVVRKCCHTFSCPPKNNVVGLNVEAAVFVFVILSGPVPVLVILSGMERSGMKSKDPHPRNKPKENEFFDYPFDFVQGPLRMTSTRTERFSNIDDIT